MIAAIGFIVGTFLVALVILAVQNIIGVYQDYRSFSDDYYFRRAKYFIQEVKWFASLHIEQIKSYFSTQFNLLSPWKGHLFFTLCWGIVIGAQIYSLLHWTV